MKKRKKGVSVVGVIYLSLEEEGGGEGGGGGEEFEFYTRISP